ncbi:TetR/AcrR family transcriptional regulator [Paenibacillus spiritus]|uniref:TetR/AcrR family transcriptional regulator n=1 Tax=Paenibacillus spiritus TaxID=2496557 RepID=UPI001CC43430|nr:TetR/AcrR family transcriptional regulator [Paenibacillus spiritus]
MKEGSYHHGDLRNTLIENGIELINEQGIGGFSLRRIAARCGVSHAAPYSHFKDKDDLLSAMAEHVTQQFADRLRSAVEAAEEPDSELERVGTAYIAFFEEHPAYFPFLFYHSGIDIHVNGETDVHAAYPPFEVFRGTARRAFRKTGLPPERDASMLMAVWSSAHGIASLITARPIHYAGNWREIWQVILQSGGQSQ